MSEEKKNARPGNKIIEMKKNSKIRSIHIRPEELENPQMDEMIRENLKREADLLEEELNNDPELMGVGASDDLFLSIVNQLKEQGVWEEAEASEMEVQEEEAKSAVDETEEIYKLLSEEDRQALLLGREVSRKKEEKKIRRQRQRRYARRIALVAAVFVVVFMMGMTSEANRRLVLNAWDAVMTMTGFKVVTNYVESEKVVRAENEEEKLAWKDAAERLGITILDFAYLPEGMVFERYEVLEDLEMVTFIYKMDKFILDVKVTSGDDAGSMYFINDENVKLMEKINMDEKVTAKIWKTNLQIEQETYIADFMYNGCRYTLNGMISHEEMKKIIKNKFFL